MATATIRVLAFAVLACVAMPALGTATASAATYHAYVCKVPFGPSAGAPASTDAITLTHNSGSGSSTQSCATGGPITAALDGAVSHTVGEGAAAIYNAPAPLSIAGLRAWRHEAVAAGGSGSGPFTNVAYGAGVSAEGGPCQQSVGCFGRGDPAVPLAPTNEVAVSNLSGIGQIRFDAFCGGAPGATCPAIGPNTKTAVMNVFAVDLLLSDTTAPVVSDVGGPLVGGTPLTGVQPVSFKATDTGSGVHEGALVVDGTVVSETVLDSAGGACADLGVSPDGQPSSKNSQPCLPALDGALSLNTDVLAPGSHELVVRIADAAGNATVATRTTITTTGPKPAGTANGSPASRLAKLSARFGTSGPRTRTLAFTTRPTITGRLVDGAGNAIAGATLDILARERRAGARQAAIESAVTGADGGFSVRLPSGPSRTITVRYTAFAGDAQPAATAVLRANVKASLLASAAQRSLPVSRPLRISGRLRHLPRRGVDIAIQAPRPAHLAHDRHRPDGRAGRFSFSYRFRSSAVGLSFMFRARVSSPIYPFAAATSRAIRVSVRR